MKYSIIIATLNREDVVGNSIESVLEQNYSDLEIIVVDQSENEETKKVVESFNDERIKYIRINKKGLSNARNEGIKSSKGKYICLLDDDAEYNEKFFEIIDEVIEKNKDISIIGGKVEDKVTSRVFLNGMDNIQRKVKFDEFDKCLVSSALVIDYKELEKINYFDDKFGVGAIYGSGEETDMILRIAYNNDNIVYVPGAIVYHPYPEKNTINPIKAFRYGEGFGALCKKHYKRYGNNRMLYIYLKSVFKQFIAFFIYSMKFDKEKAMYYKKSILGKFRGFQNYEL